MAVGEWMDLLCNGMASMEMSSPAAQHNRQSPERTRQERSACCGDQLLGPRPSRFFKATGMDDHGA
jgi:hypothetical protein